MTQSQERAFELKDVSAQCAGIKIWTLTFDLPGEKVNKLNPKVMAEFETILKELEDLGAEQADAVVLLSGKPGNFIAGADIEMILGAKSEEEARTLSLEGHKLFARWEDLPFPTVVAIDGAAVGGGCELSLASSAIVMSNDPAARIGLPEVLLGLIPGIGGCIRLPRKVGLATALDMILTGKTLTGERAYKAGLAEACLPKQDFKDYVLKWVKTNLVDLKAGKRLAKEPKLAGMGGPLGTMMEKTRVGRSYILKKAREGVLSKTKGHYPAPLEAVSVISDTHGAYGSRILGNKRERAIQREAEGFAKSAATDVSKNLIRIFFLTDSVKKSKGLPPGISANAHPIHTAGVLGAGVMGGGIAQLFAAKEITTRMKDLNNQALSLGIQSASKIFKRDVQKKKMSSREFVQKLNHIAPVTDYSGFRSLDLVIEAIVENLQIKQKVLQELEGQIQDDTIVASNTSSLSISTMQSVMKVPERFVGMHFFNPVHKMPLVEVIRGEKTSDAAVTTIFQLSKALGKTPIVVKDSPGFLVNRLLAPYLNESNYLLADGAPIEEIDRALLKFGLPMGPMELIDEVGVDVADKVAHILYDAFGARLLACQLLSKVIAQGRLGKKKSKGIFEYDTQGRNKKLNPQIYEILGITPHAGALSENEMVERTIYPMINEACRCLDEGIVSSPAEVDLGMIMGMGFPPFRGGLLRFADSLGSKVILEGLKKYQARFGARFEPAPSLISRAEHDQRFYPA